MNDKCLTDERLDSLKESISEGFQRMEKRFDKIDSRMDKTDDLVRIHGEKIAGIEQVMSDHREKIDKVDERIDKEKENTFKSLIVKNSGISLALSIAMPILIILLTNILNS